MSNPSILTLNAGSSSLKFALYVGDAADGPGIRGQVDRIGDAAAIELRFGDAAPRRDAVAAPDHTAALAAALGLIEARHGRLSPDAVGHRIVHGGPSHAGPAVLNDTVIAGLEALVPFAPLHQPHNLSGVQAARRAFPAALQVACFDTSFHRAQPMLNKLFALPYAYYERGICRYGFHGLSYDHIASVLSTAFPEVAGGRVIVAHLGNGASMCAIANGQSVASSMGFSALEGLPMGTRCGQIDPGVILYLMREEGLDADEISDLLYKRSGLLGLSGMSNDMRTLQTSADPAAKMAIAYFVARIQRETGALAASMQGLDAFVFTAGIGEHAAALRAAVCDGLGWLGLTVDATRNAAHAQRISPENGRCPVFVIPTDEEGVIARKTRAMLAKAGR
ncbi:MAG: acetate/propionate family kinase [Pseudomonadota bacterium]